MRRDLRTREAVDEHHLPARHVRVDDLLPALGAHGGLLREQTLRLAVQELQGEGDHARIVQGQRVTGGEQLADIWGEAGAVAAEQLADENVVHLEGFAERRVGLWFGKPFAQGRLASAGSAKNEDDGQ